MARSDALTRLADWFDDRTDFRAGRTIVRDRLLPHGTAWGFATGSCTLVLFLVVVATGVFLMAGYSPAADHGWSSVFLIESTPGGSFLRGLHYFGSHALIILFGIHLTRAILTASFRAPRELAWIAGVLLLPLLIGEAVTGNPLSASNKAFGQIEVESHILGSTPIIGPLARSVLVGGDEVGNLTITRLYALHVFVLPLLALLLLVFHLYQHLRWGTANSAAGTALMPETHIPPTVTDDDGNQIQTVHDASWPAQGARNALVFAIVFGAVAFLALRYEVPLHAPADPTLTEMPRPEWYFRALFELKNSLSGSAEFFVTGVLPALFLAFLIALPWIDGILPRSAAVMFRYAVVILAAAGWVVLTTISFSRDYDDEKYRSYLPEAEARAERAKLIASVNGIPPQGPSVLLQSDPLTQGPRLFRQHCANCHPHVDAAGGGIEAKTPVAPNLYGFASRAWIAGLLDPERITGPDYFGHTSFVKEGTSMGMIDYVRDELYAVEGDELAVRKEQVRKIVLALSAEAALPEQSAADKQDAAAITEGRTLLTGDVLGDATGCIGCHKFHDAGELGSAPDLTGYGSRDWLAAFASNPAHERFYDGNNDGMPSFHHVEGESPQNILSRDELLLVVDWLRGQWLRE
ncbi:MAG: cytochrome b N-terminal domain-containing protein [Planctomycetaceae bacterium]